MVDVYETQVKVKFDIPTGEVDKIKNIAGSALGGLGKLGAAAGVAGAIVMSSPSLQNTLNKIVKSVMMLLRPIGDIIAVGLRPIIDILRPIGLFFRILMKPYIRKAMEAMRVGRGFMAKGAYGQAAESYALGVGFLLKPIFDMMVTQATIMVQGVIAGLKVLGTSLLDALGAHKLADRFGAVMDGMIQKVGTVGANIIVETDVMMEEMLVRLKQGYENMKDLTDVSMRGMNQIMGEQFINILNVATNFFAPSLESTTNQMFDDILNYGRERVNELNRMLNQPTRSTSGGGGGFVSRTEWARTTQLANQVGVSEGLAAKMNEISINYYGVTPDQVKEEVERGVSNALRSGGGGSSGAG